MKDVLLISTATFGIQAFVTLFVIMDPPGATPIFLALVKNQPLRRRVLMAWQGAGVSLIVIITFAIFGKFILDYLHISVEALQGAQVDRIEHVEQQVDVLQRQALGVIEQQRRLREDVRKVALS